MVVSGCANVATNTPLPVSTATSIPSPTLIPPTATVEPSPTVDPNMPPDATGKDEQGNWIKPSMENGKPLIIDEKPVMATWEPVPIGPNGKMTSEWVVDHIVNPANPTAIDRIPLIDEPGDNADPRIFVHLDVKETIQAPFIKHVQNMADFNGIITFSNVLYTKILEQYYVRNFGRKPTAQDVRDFYKVWNDGFTLPVTDAAGTVHYLTISKDAPLNVNIHLVDPADITPNFVLQSFSSVTTFNSDGSIDIVVADSMPAELLSPEPFTFVILNRLLQMFVVQDQSQVYSKSNYFYLESVLKMVG